MQNRSAFSLIELSIVLIIVGLLIGGIIAGQKMISLARLTSARTLTNSSPVNVIEDLVLWLETTSKKSFDKSEMIDEATVTTWYDINPQSTVKFNATGANNPVYLKDKMGGLPGIFCSGTAKFGLGNVLDPAEDFTIYLVNLKDSTSTTSWILQLAVGNVYIFRNNGATIRSILGGIQTNSPSTQIGNPHIVSIIHDTSQTSTPPT